METRVLEFGELGRRHKAEKGCCAEPLAFVSSFESKRLVWKCKCYLLFLLGSDYRTREQTLGTSAKGLFEFHQLVPDELKALLYFSIRILS